MEEPVCALEFPAQRALMALDDSRPCSSSGDEYPLVPSSFAAAEIPPGLLDHDELDSLQGDDLKSNRDYGYHSSASSTGHSSERDLEDERLLRAPSSTSSHSSVSSIPPSALVHSSDALKLPETVGTRQHTYHHSGAFRRQNSVPSIQIHSGDESDKYETSWRGGGQHHSGFSMRSPGSPPMKRLPYYSPRGSASKQRIRREYPLVLLHCNLLPPSLPVIGYNGVPNQKILKEVLPTKYYRRWKLLGEKVGSGVLRDRGVLISHPEDTYDLLEERLLESLELQQPRLHHGHFLGQHEYDSDRDDDATDDEQGEVCPDCGGRVVTCNDQNRKWEIKVFAANGLMRAGAWAAAWKEMERVDVEVGLWLPRDVRRELERRLMDDESEHKLPSEPIEPVSEMNWRSYPPSAQEEAHSQLTKSSSTIINSSLSLASPPASQGQEQVSPNINQKSAEEIDLRTLLINYICVLASDRRNVAIGILSIFVAFLAISSARVAPSTSSSKLQAFPQEKVASVPTSVMSKAQHHGISADVSSVLSSIPSFVADESQVPSTKEDGAAGLQVPYSGMPTTSSELVPASMSTEAEWQDYVAVDDTSAKSPEAFDRPDMELQRTSVSVDQSEEPMVGSMEQASDQTRNDHSTDSDGEVSGKDVDVQIESLELTGFGKPESNAANSIGEIA